jgi:hypothetical protein
MDDKKDGKFLAREIRRRAAMPNYLEEFSNKLAEREELYQKLMLEFSGEHVDSPLKVKPVKGIETSIMLGHKSPLRIHEDSQELVKTKILISFGKLREVVECEMRRIAVKIIDGKI